MLIDDNRPRNQLRELHDERQYQLAQQRAFLQRERILQEQAANRRLAMLLADFPEGLPLPAIAKKLGVPGMRALELVERALRTNRCYMVVTRDGQTHYVHR